MDKRRSLSEQIDVLFSRSILGMLLVSLTIGKVIEKLISLYAPSQNEQLIAWSIAAFVAILIYLFWNKIEDPIDGLKKNLRD